VKRHGAGSTDSEGLSLTQVCNLRTLREIFDAQASQGSQDLTGFRMHRLGVPTPIQTQSLSYVRGYPIPSLHAIRCFA
jgi:hypothetical protein